MVFLAERLSLSLKERARPFLISHGADFLGYIVRPHYCLVRRRVVDNLKQRLNAFAAAYVNEQGIQLKPEARDQLRAVLASYLGHFAHAHAYRLVQSIWRRYAWLNVLFRLLPDYALQPLWEPLQADSYRGQWDYFHSTYAPAWVLIQIGNRIELYNDDALACLRDCPASLRLSGCGQRPRQYFRHTVSWPIKQRRALQTLWRKAGQFFMFIAEEGGLRQGLKRRVLREYGVLVVLAPKLQFGSVYRQAQLDG